MTFCEAVCVLPRRYKVASARDTRIPEDSSLDRLHVAYKYGIHAQITLLEHCLSTYTHWSTEVGGAWLVNLPFEPSIATDGEPRETDRTAKRQKRMGPP
jgi:hypothetical protein